MNGVKIIGGSARGRSIRTFKNDLSVRPLLGRIKKSLFDILCLKVPDSDFLDLYAGVGSVGIEAISRGAAHVVFIDSDRRCTQLIKKNLEDLKFTNYAAVYQSDVTGGLSWLKQEFDIVFLGPPYKDSEKTPLALTTLTLGIIAESNILKKNGCIISQHHIKEQVAVPDQFRMFRREKYGDTVVSFIVRE